MDPLPPGQSLGHYVTDTESPVEADHTAPDPSRVEFDRLRARFPKAQDTVLFCIHALQQDEDIRLDDLRARARLHGLNVTRASLHSARSLLSAAKSGAMRGRKGGPRKGTSVPGSSCSSRIRELLDSGMTARGIAERVGFSTNLVYVVSSNSRAGRPDSVPKAPTGIGDDVDRPPATVTELQRKHGVLFQVRDLLQRAL